MKDLFCALCLLGAGCESCDFSFGPIPLEIHVTPADARGTVTLCDKEGKDVRCATLTFPQDPSEQPLPVPIFRDPPPEGTIYTAVGWDGYIACRHPGLEIDVDAEGCKPLHASIPHRNPRGQKTMRIDLALDCP